MTKTFAARRDASSGMTAERIAEIERWERYFRLRNGDRSIDGDEFDNMYLFFAGKRLDEGERADWDWLLGIFERHDRSRKESREPPLQLPHGFPRNSEECRAVIRWRASNPR